jgi:hypothetical protein
MEIKVRDNVRVTLVRTELTEVQTTRYKLFYREKNMYKC